MHVTKETHFSLKDLKANTNYAVQIQYVTSHGDSIRSDPTVFRTDDECRHEKSNRIFFDHPLAF